MTRRVVAVLLRPPSWTPPGLDPARWRRALADDVVDLLSTLAEVEPALAVLEADRDFAAAVGWPGLNVYALPELTVPAVLASATAGGYDQAAVVAADAPDLPGMQIAKLLRPLTTRPVTAAPATESPSGLLGIASRLPAPSWLPDVDLESATVSDIRRAAPAAADVIGTPGWHRLRTPESLTHLDPALDSWESTRTLLTRGPTPAP
ncbi:MAG TPA: hypothetical protein VKB69_14565 [Micromonosporaceae bacterium]|nr:hypothetical protein [Micromonosporaceae bacterium]